MSLNENVINNTEKQFTENNLLENLKVMGNQFGSIDFENIKSQQIPKIILLNFIFIIYLALYIIVRTKIPSKLVDKMLVSKPQIIKINKEDETSPVHELYKKKCEIQNNLINLLVTKQENISSIIPNSENMIDNIKSTDDIKTSEDINYIENKLIDHLNLIISTKQLDIMNFASIVVELIKFIENFSVDGKDKKAIVLSVITKFLEKQNYKSEQIYIIVNIICNELIDIMISFDKGHIKITESCGCLPFCI